VRELGEGEDAALDLKGAADATEGEGAELCIAVAAIVTGVSWGLGRVV